MNPTPRLLITVVLAAFTFHCGDNIEEPGAFGPPQNIRAVSVDISTIRVEWSPAAASADSTFRGYVVRWGTRADTLSKTTFVSTIDSLAQGETLVTLYSLLISGRISEPATIRWAPAARFDSAVVVYESNTLISTRQEGVNVGTRTTNPSTMIMDPSSDTVRQTMDLYFYGGLGQSADSLTMRSANLFHGALNLTRFSTVTHAAPSLDYAIAAFPNEGTFTQNNIRVVDNTIYYARVVGDNSQEVNYCRIHLHVRPGTVFPNRIIEVRISLQRMPGLLFAAAADISPGGAMAEASTKGCNPPGIVEKGTGEI